MPFIHDVKLSVGYEGSDICSRPNVKSILEYLGYSDHDALLAQNWSFSYLPNPSKNDRMIAIGGSVDGVYNQGLRRAGFRSRMVLNDDDSAAWQIVKDSIDTGMPLLLWVDGYFLPFQKHRYRQSHTFHTVICTGYQNDKTAHVMDGWASVQYEGPMDLDLLKQARSSQNGADEPEISWVAGNPVRNRYLDLGPPSEIPSLNELAVAYVNSTIEAARSDAGTSQNSRAIRLMAINIVEWRNLGDTEQSKKLFDLYWLLISVIVEKRNGARILRHLDSEKDSGPLLHEEAEVISQEWVICRNLIYRASKTLDEQEFERLLARLENLAQHENRFIERMATGT
jgi:hypothetical protein